MTEKEIMPLTLEEICEAVESYWGKRKTGKQVKIIHCLIPRFNPDTYKITDYVFQYEVINP